MIKEPSVGQIALGFLLGLALNLAVILGVALLPVVPASVFYGFVFFGATQLIWQLPLILLLRRKHNNWALGVLIASLATAVLWALVGHFEYR